MDTAVNVVIAGALIVACFVVTRQLAKRLQRNRTMRALSVAVLMRQMVNHLHSTMTTKHTPFEDCCVCDATLESRSLEKNQPCCCQQLGISGNMPLPRPCLRCNEVARATYCDNCQPIINKVREARRPSRTQRGYDYRWNKLSKQLRELHPWCAQCGSTKDLTVDHIIPLSDLHPQLRYEISNLQVLCRSCNSQKGSS